MTRGPLYQATRLAEDERNALVHYYNQLNETERLDAHKLQVDLLRQQRETLKGLGLDLPAMNYATLLIALAKRKELARRMSRKDAEAVKHAEQIAAMRLQSVQGARRKRKAKILSQVRVRFYSIIEDLRKRGVSWRDIAEYLRRYHRRKISHTYLQKAYSLIRAEKEKAAFQGDAGEAERPTAPPEMGV